MHIYIYYITDPQNYIYSVALDYVPQNEKPQETLAILGASFSFFLLS